MILLSTVTTTTATDLLLSLPHTRANPSLVVLGRRGLHPFRPQIYFSYPKVIQKQIGFVVFQGTIHHSN